MSATTDTVTTIATCIGAGATLVLAGAAICALRGWRSTLQNERADDCTGTAADFDAAIGRYRAAAQAGSESGPVYDEMWNARTRLKVAVWRARRYYPDLRNINIKTIDDKLRDLRKASTDDAKEIHEDIDKVLRPIFDIPPVP
jgi:hypothetical protein